MHWTGHEYNCCNDSFSWIANFNVLCKQFLSTTAWGQAVFCGGGNVIPSSTMDCGQVEPWAGKPICCYYSPSASPRLRLQNNRHTHIISHRTKVRNISQNVVLFLGKERPGELVEILMPRSSPPVSIGCDNWYQIRVLLSSSSFAWYVSSTAWLLRRDPIRSRRPRPAFRPSSTAATAYRRLASPAPSTTRPSAA